MSVQDAADLVYGTDRMVQLYLKKYYSNPKTMVDWPWYHMLFNEGKYSGHRLLQLGSGPSVCELISISPWYDEIISSDYTEANRREIMKWKQATPGAYNWQPYFDYIVGELEGKSEEKVEVRKNELRRKIIKVLPCDVHLTNPLFPNTEEPFDAVLCVCVLECACDNKQELFQCLKNVWNLLNNHGHFFLQIELCESAYEIDGATYSCLKIDNGLKVMKDLLKNAGYKILLAYEMEDYAANCENNEGSLHFILQKNNS